MASRILEVILNAKDNASAVVGKAEANIGGSASRITSLVKGLVATAAAAAVGKFFADSAKSAMEAEKSMAGLSAALAPLGIRYDDVKGRTEAYLTSLQRTTRFGDEQYRDTLARMVAVTGDFEGSLKMLPTVAGIAINRNMDLAAASDLVSKAMNGNTTALKKLGIEIPAGADAMEVLREKFEQIATKDGETFSARLVQLKNGWDDFKEAVGFAIIGSEGMTNATGGLVTILARLSDFISENQEFIGSFIEVVFALGEAVWAIVRLPLKAFLTVLGLIAEATGVVLVALGTMIEKGGALLAKFGIDVGTKVGASIREAGEAMIKTTNAGYKALWGETKKGEDALTSVVQDSAGKRTQATKDELAAQAKARKDAAKLRADLEEEIWVKSKMLQEGITEKEAKELLKREQNLGRSLGVQVTNIEMAYERIDRLNEKLKMGWTRHLDSIIKAQEDFAPKVSDTTLRLRSAYGSLEEQIAAVARVGATAREKITDFSAAQEEARRKTDAFREALVDSSRGAIGMAQGLGAIGDTAAASLQNVASLGDGLTKLLTGGITTGGVVGAITSVVGSVASLAKSLFGESPEEKARKDLIRKNTEALRGLTQATGDLLKVQASGNQITKIRDFLGGLFGPGGQYTKGAYTAGKMRTGITDAEVEALAAELGISVRNSKSGAIEAKGLFQLFQGLQGLDSGFANTFKGQRERITTGIGLGAITQDQEFAQILKAIESLGGNNAILSALQGADFSTMEGRGAAANTLRDLFTAFSNNQIKADQLGGLSGSEFIDTLGDLIAILTDADRAITGVGDLRPDTPGLDLSTAFGDLSVTFEDIGMQQVDYLASIDTQIGGLLERWTDIDTGRVVQAAPVTISVGEVVVTTAATDAAGTGEAVQAAVTAAINQALADAYLDRQLATGNVTRTVS